MPFLERCKVVMMLGEREQRWYDESLDNLAVSPGIMSDDWMRYPSGKGHNYFGNWMWRSQFGTGSEMI